jgi:hypothetical protein
MTPLLASEKWLIAAIVKTDVDGGESDRSSRPASGGNQHYTLRRAVPPKVNVPCSNRGGCRALHRDSRSSMQYGPEHHRRFCCDRGSRPPCYQSRTSSRPDILVDVGKQYGRQCYCPLEGTVVDGAELTAGQIRIRSDPWT